MIQIGGETVLVGGKTIPHPGRFVDTFERIDPAQTAVGNGWSNLSDVRPLSFDPLGINSAAGGLVCLDPYARRDLGVEMVGDNLWEDYAEYPGLAVGGIGAIYRDTGGTAYEVSAMIGGRVTGTQGENLECSPLVGVVPGSPRGGYGVWFVVISGVAIGIAGYISDPPEDFFVAYASRPIAHTFGTPRLSTIKYDGTGYTWWVDGVQQDMRPLAGGTFSYDPIPVHSDHYYSPLAGVALDAHLQYPQSTTPSRLGCLHYEHQVV